MAKKLVKYKLEGDGSTPKWIEDGGYFEEGHIKIGLTVDDDKYWVPTGLSTVTVTQLKALMKRTMKKDDGSSYTDEEITEKHTNFKNRKQFSRRD